MAATWAPHPESDDEVDLSFNSPDPALYGHLAKLIDGVTKQRITPATQLVPLYRFDDQTVDNALLRNVTGIARPKIPCQVDLGNELYPPTADAVAHGYHLWLTFNKLLLAPAVRLECNFVEVDDAESGEASIYLTIALDFHFNDYDGPESGIKNYQYDGRRISFISGPPTLSGFNLRARHSSKMGTQELRVINALTSLLSSEQHAITIHLKGAGVLSMTAHGQLKKITDRLPGGAGILLPSIGQPEYVAYGEYRSHIHCLKGATKKPITLVSGAAKVPMIPMDCSDTFSTVKEAGVELAYSAVIADAEVREALRLWSSVMHVGHLFVSGGFAVVGVRFKPFPTLGSVTDELHFRLPRDQNAELVFPHPRNTAVNAWVKGLLIENLSGLPSSRFDAFFQITSETLEFFGGEAATSLFHKLGYFDLKVTARHNESTFTSQLETINQLQKATNRQWHQVLLNQAHDCLDEVDLTQASQEGAQISPETRSRADEWLRNWMSWNAEQLQVIEGIRAAKGGVIIVMGPAGTGKTLLQQALTIYFYMLGFHVLALAPANSNADHLAAQLRKVNANEARKDDVSRIQPALEILRLYPSTKDSAPDTEEQVDFGKMGRRGGNLYDLHEFLMALDTFKQDRETSRACGVVHTLINAAVDGDLALRMRLRKEGDMVDPWNLVREFIQQYAEGGDIRARLIAADNDKALETYRLAYTACKGQIIGLNRFMVTTTGNVRSRDLREYWYSAEQEYGVKRIGVMVFVDEAAKDVEANVWGGIVCEKWAHAVKGVVMFGDDKQLRPTNTCAKGPVEFNAYSGRLDIPLPCRLMREGFPFYRLLEQRRMHSAISAFPNREIYHGKLRDGAGMHASIEEGMPGFRDILIRIQADYGISDAAKRDRYIADASDHLARLHWIEVKGTRVRHPSTKSIYVREHVDVFFDKIFPRIRQYFGSKVNENVMIICAYSYALHEYNDRINALLAHDKNLKAENMPRVLTVDASQGQESYMVVFDGSCQHGDVLGFMEDVGRCNVAITRAQEVFWVIGGEMGLRFKERPTALLTKYKRVMDAQGNSHPFKSC